MDVLNISEVFKSNVAEKVRYYIIMHIMSNPNTYSPHQLHAIHISSYYDLWKSWYIGTKYWQTFNPGQIITNFFTTTIEKFLKAHAIQPLIGLHTKVINLQNITLKVWCGVTQKLPTAWLISSVNTSRSQTYKSLLLWRLFYISTHIWCIIVYTIYPHAH